MVGKRGDSAPESAPPCVRPLNLWLSPLQEPHVDVFVDDACSYKLHKSTGRWHKKLRINSDLKYLVSSATESIPAWEKNDWKTAENKPIENRTEFEKLKKALEQIELIWNHVSDHSGIEGNEAADQLASSRIEEKSAAATEPCDDINEPSGSTRVVVDVPRSYTNSEESNDDDNDNGNVIMATLKEDLQNSFTQSEKSIEKKGLDLSKLNTDSLCWDQEGMDVSTYSVCIHVSEGEEDEELLKNLEALELCGEFYDDAFPQNIDLLENQEMVTKAWNPDFQLLDIQPGYFKIERKSTN